MSWFSARPRVWWMVFGSALVVLALSLFTYRAQRSKKTTTRETFACAAFEGTHHRPPSRFPTDAVVMTCTSLHGPNLAQLRADLTALTGLPPELCLREPWAPIAREEADRQARARRTVLDLKVEGDVHRAPQRHTKNTGKDASAQADNQRAVTGMEALLQAHPLWFDRDAAAAFLAHERLKLGAPDDAELVRHQHALSVLLGRRADCPSPLSLEWVSVPKDDEVTVVMSGDPSELASHFCAVGCEAVSVVW